jgi:autotransporter-associated beta strand protein
MKSLATLNRAAMAATIVGSLCLLATRAGALTQNYYGTSGALSGSVWSTNPAGPYTSAFDTADGGGVMNFDNIAIQAGGNNSRVVAGISATQNFSITGSPSGSITNEGNVVIPINVAAGATLDFGSQAFTTSATAGYNFTGPGTLALLGGTYGGGFTINSGTLIVRGVNAMGSAVSNTLTINGGTIAGNANRTLAGKFPGGISVNGDFTLGDSTGLASATATLTFDNNVNLNGGTHTITVGNNAQHTFNTGSGVISNGGLVIDAVSGATGRILLLGQNTYAGGTTIKTGATLSTNAISSMGVGPITSGPLGVGSLTLDGGRYIPSSGGNASIANDVVLNNVATNTITNSSTGTNVSVMSGNFTGRGGFT